jgi:hypothetical protein
VEHKGLSGRCRLVFLLNPLISEASGARRFRPLSGICRTSIFCSESMSPGPSILR